jgi:glutamine cyclotransferase
VPPIARQLHLRSNLDRGKDQTKSPDTFYVRGHLLRPPGFNGTGWIRTDNQIDLYGDQGFRGVAFRRPESVHSGDKVDVDDTREALQWCGVVGG